MLPLFCLRLAGGLIAWLGLVLPLNVNPRFYRVQFLTALGLTACAALMVGRFAGAGLLAVLCVASALAFSGFLAWSLEGAPAGKSLVLLTAAAVLLCTFGTDALVSRQRGAEVDPRVGFKKGSDPFWKPAWPVALTGWQAADDVTSAAVLGAAMTAMLMGHFYLIAPTMSLTPLLRLLGALFVALVLRLAVASVGLWCWTAGHSLVNLEDVTVLWLPLRWGVGFIAPLVLTWMAREAAKIRSTQSATGILYVVVIFCFLGELTSQLLLDNTGYFL